jgi:hypothetical protein
MPEPLTRTTLDPEVMGEGPACAAFGSRLGPSSASMSLALLVDMNPSPVWVDWFALGGFSTVHWSAVGNARASDRTALAWAAQHGNVLLTHDLDFGAILAA